MKLLTINRVFFSFIVSGRLFREKWPVYLILIHIQNQLNIAFTEQKMDELFLKSNSLKNYKYF